MIPDRFNPVCLSLVTLTMLAACGAPPAGDPAKAAAAAAVSENCVTIADGLYEAVDGQFMAVAAGSAGTGGAANWQSQIQSGFAGLGFPWMGLKIRGKVATLTGTAPSAEAKVAALAAGETAVMAHPEAGPAGLLVVDAIAVEGGERGVGESLSVLADSGVSLGTCQTAFTDTMAGRKVTFESGNANISPVSARLLDAVTGVASLCSAFAVEIGGHTDANGADDFNLKLSKDRADAVRAYLVSKGVSEDGLISVGYGETVPLESARSPEAYEKNRRTEFKVIER